MDVNETLRGPSKAKTIVSLLLLHLVQEEPDHAYKLKERAKELSGDFLTIQLNQVYSALHEMEELGFVAGAWNHPTKRSQRTYTITKNGKKRLALLKETFAPYLAELREKVLGLRAILSE